MSFRSIVRDVRDGFGSLSRRGFEVRILGHRRGKSHGAVHELDDPAVPVIQSSCWASLPPELLRDIIERLEASEATWPSRKHVVACAGVCRTWREMCKEIVKNPQFCGKITFPISLKQPGPRDGSIQCFIRRDKSTQTYYLYLSLGSDGSNVISSMEALCIFLYILANNLPNAHANNRFVWSNETVSASFHRVLEAVYLMAQDIIKPIDLSFKTIPEQIQNNPKSQSFSNVVGAIDGTHMPIHHNRRNPNQRKNLFGCTRNVFVIVDFDGRVMFADVGWPGLFPDDQILSNDVNVYPGCFPNLSIAVLVDNGKFLLSAKRNCRATCTEYVISMNANSISRSTNNYIGKLRSNFLGTKFVIYDTHPPYNATSVSQSGKTSQRFYSNKGTAKLPSSRYNIANISYELNVFGTRGPRRMRCLMHSIPASSLEAGGSVPCQPDSILAHSLNESSFRSVSFSKSSIMEHSMHFSSARFSDISIGDGPRIGRRDFSDDEECKETPLILHNKAPRWHEQLQCWCLNFRGRVTVASVKNFQLIAATQPAAGAPTPSQPAPPPPPEHDKVILQFGKVAKDMFTMDYRYPLSAFQAFAISLSSFDTKLACE